MYVESCILNIVSLPNTRNILFTRAAIENVLLIKSIEKYLRKNPCLATLQASCLQFNWKFNSFIGIFKGSWSHMQYSCWRTLLASCFFIWRQAGGFFSMAKLYDKIGTIKRKWRNKVILSNIIPTDRISWYFFRRCTYRLFRPQHVIDELSTREKIFMV